MDIKENYHKEGILGLRQTYSCIQITDTIIICSLGIAGLIGFSLQTAIGIVVGILCSIGLGIVTIYNSQNQKKFNKFYKTEVK